MIKKDIKSQPLVVIVILNFNGLSDTLECLESLDHISYRNYKIIVVDNGSSDNSYSVLTSTYPKLAIYENIKNEGYAEGNNVGIKYGMSFKPDYFLLLNNDTIVKKDFLTKLVDIASKDTKIGILGPKILFHDKKNVLWFAGAKFWFNNEPFKHLGWGEADKGQYDSIHETDYITGCSMMIRASALKKVGYLDKQYFCYFEDLDLNVRVKKAGYKTVFVPDSVVWHKVSRSTGGEGNPTLQFYKARNMVLFQRKVYHAKNFGIYLKLKVFEGINYLVSFQFRKAYSLFRGLLMGYITPIQKLA